MWPGHAWIALSFTLMGLLVGCGESAQERDVREWRLAEKAFQEGGERSVFRVWKSLDTTEPLGREAHRRLLAADKHYHRAIELFRNDQPGVREAMQEGIALGPIDPAHYLTLARACAERGVTFRAVDFYRKYLQQYPAPEEARAARAELAGLAGSNDPFPLLFPEDRPPSEPVRTVRPAPWPIVSLILPLSLLLLLRLRNRRRRLRILLVDRPEWHQTVTYHLGCLRHEFLKHRVGPLGEPLRAIARGQAKAEENQFLRERLAQSLPLLSAWREQLHPLERSLGLSWELDRTDPMFRQARCALKRLQRIHWPLGPRQASKLLDAHAAVMRIDRQLSQLVSGLVRCPIDERLLVEIVEGTRLEWAIGKVALDEIRIGPVPVAVEIDVFRVDLRIVLKNIVRNAIHALGQAPPPRRLALDVLVEMEPTGEEFVVFRVRDSSPNDIGENVHMGHEVEHGLGIVSTALRRYDGSMQVVPGSDGYAKAVLVRFFHSQRNLAHGAVA
jgi:signal transduction histidine kinase